MTEEHVNRLSQSPESRGLYVPRELAGYFRAATPLDRWAPSPQRLFYWIRRGLIAAEFRDAPAREILATFNDLVTSQAITLLKEAGFPIQKIKQAEAYFADALGISQPFTHRQFWTSGPDIFGRVGERLIAGTRGGQIAMEFMAQWLTPVEAHFAFDPATDRSVAWEPQSHVELRPTVQFGQPCISGTRIPTASIMMYVSGGDPPRFVADFFGITEAEVEAAVAWESGRALQVAA